MLFSGVLLEASEIVEEPQGLRVELSGGGGGDRHELAIKQSLEWHPIGMAPSHFEGPADQTRGFQQRGSGGSQSRVCVVETRVLSHQFQLWNSSCEPFLRCDVPCSWHPGLRLTVDHRRVVQWKTAAVKWSVAVLTGPNVCVR